MENYERDGFVKLLLGIAEMYSKTISKIVIKLYWQTLHIYPLQDVACALRLHTQDPDAGQYMPKPADVIRMITGNSQSQGLQAWSKVEHAIRCVGPYCSVVFDEAVIHVVLQDMGGWVKLCKVSDKDLPFTAREFLTRYTSCRTRTPENYPKKLTGLAEHHNIIQGHDNDLIVFCGDVAKAQSVLSSGCDSAPIRITHIKKLSNPLIKQVGYA